MDLSFNDLKYLITVVSEDLGNDDFDNFQDSNTNPDSLSEVSEEMYDKVSVLATLLIELYKHRPLSF